MFRTISRIKDIIPRYWVQSLCQVRTITRPLLQTDPLYITIARTLKMSEPVEDEKPFAVDIAKQGRAVCKKCKQKCPQGELRLAKLMANPFGSGKMKSWHHVNCMFDVFQKQRPATARIEDPINDTEGWNEISSEGRDLILERLKECNEFFESKHGITPKKINTEVVKTAAKPSDANIKLHKDDSFREFRRLVADITNVSAYLEKTELVNKLFTKGSDGSGFKGDIVLWCRLLLPGVVKRIYNLQSKQIIKLFSRIFDTDHEEMLEHLEQGDVSETIQTFFERSKTFKPAKKSSISLAEVDEFLEKLSTLTKEDEQMNHLKQFAKKCTANELKVVVRLIKHDLRMNAGAKHILDGVHPDAYTSYQSSRDIEAVIKRCLNNSDTKNNVISLMTPVLPMLAEACKSVEQAMKKCPNGLYSEIKYDGERVQVHKNGNEFRYYSRSLKPVLPHKVEHFKEFIPRAFPKAVELILDSEILMIDTKTGKPLPFGTLGVHKKNKFQDACVCLFVFDCIYYNGEVLGDKPIKYRKKILKEVMVEIPNHVVFSEMEEIHDPQDLTNMIAKVLKLGLEGLVLKDLNSPYEPGKRHWLKVKKDYLFDGAMADSADLIVLGAWYGTGKKGGMMSVFLMGCYDPVTNKFSTVTKVHTGHDDKTLERLQDQLKMTKISGDTSKVPHWLKCTKTMCPDFVAQDPQNQPVWEITGAEFTQHEVHTADGISIRFPRVTKIRDDKNWKTATSLQELRDLYRNSKESVDVTLLMKNIDRDKDGPSPQKKPRLASKQKTITSFMNKVDIRNPLPDHFQGVSIVLSDAVAEENRDLIRYFIAYGGRVIKDRVDHSDATHFIHSENLVVRDVKCSNVNIKHVTVEWLRNCVIMEKVVDYKPYAVFCKPN